MKYEEWYMFVFYKGTAGYPGRYTVLQLAVCVCVHTVTVSSEEELACIESYR